MKRSKILKIVKNYEIEEAKDVKVITVYFKRYNEKNFDNLIGKLIEADEKVGLDWQASDPEIAAEQHCDLWEMKPEYKIRLQICYD